MKYPEINIDKSEGWENRPTGIIQTKEDGTLEYKSLNEWQLCPKCNGKGSWEDMVPGIFVLMNVMCDLCNGKKIISKIDGNPPE